MKNENHLSIEGYHKLNRSSAVASAMRLDLLSRPLDGMHQLYIPHLFSYIHEDVRDVLEELKEKGLCDKWLGQERAKLKRNSR